MTCVLVTDDPADAPFGLSAELDHVIVAEVGYNSRLRRAVAILLPDGRYIFPRCLQIVPSITADVLIADEARHVLRAAVRRYGASPTDRGGGAGRPQQQRLRLRLRRPAADDRVAGLGSPVLLAVDVGRCGDGRGNWNGPPHGFMNGGWATRTPALRQRGAPWCRWCATTGKEAPNRSPPPPTAPNPTAKIGAKGPSAIRPREPTHLTPSMRMTPPSLTDASRQH